jgi:hypothetical protein
LLILLSGHSHGKKLARYQWFWAGTHEDTKKLTPDLKHTVTRHVVVKRIMPVEGFPFGSVETEQPKRKGRRKETTELRGEHDTRPRGTGKISQAASTKPACGRDDSSLGAVERLLKALKRHFRFDFCIEVR